MHLFDWSWRECFSYFKTVSSDVPTSRHKTKPPLQLSEHDIIYAQWNCFKRKDHMHPFKKGLKNILPKHEEWGLNSLTHQHHSWDFSPRLDSMADYSVVVTNSPRALYPVALSTYMKTLSCKAWSCLKIRGCISKYSDGLTLCGSNKYSSKHK